jgi:hypothetical protein
MDHKYVALDIKLKAWNKYLVFYLFEIYVNDDALTTVYTCGTWWQNDTYCIMTMKITNKMRYID